MTPYHYVSNNPINRIDPDGRWDWYQSNATGTVKWFEGAGEQDGFRHIGAQGTVISSGENAGIVNLNIDGSATNAATGEQATYSTSGKTRIVEKDNTSEGYKMFLDIFSGGAYSRESRALDILDRDGLKAYNYQKVSDAHTEIFQGWMAGEYQLGASGRVAAKTSTNIKYLGRMEDLKGIPRSQTILDELPNLGSPKANYYQNMSVIRRNLREGVTFKDASWFRSNSELAPTLSWPTRTVVKHSMGQKEI